MTVLTPQEFAKKGAGVALSERSSYQQHFLDLCAMLGAPAPAEADPAGSSTPSRRGWRRPGAARASPTCGTRTASPSSTRPPQGSEGRLRSAPAVPGGAGHPPLLVVTDTDRYEVHTDFTGTVKRMYRFDNAALPKAENVGVLQALFEDPEALRPGYTVEGITEEASFGTPAPKSSSIKGQTAVGRIPSRQRTWRSTRRGPCESSAPNARDGSRQERGQHLTEGAKRELRRARRPPL